MRWSITKHKIYGGVICQLRPYSRITAAFLRAGKLSRGNIHPNSSRVWDSLLGWQTMTWRGYSCQSSPWPQLQDLPCARDFAAARRVWRARSTADHLCKRSHRNHSSPGFGFLPSSPQNYECAESRAVRHSVAWDQYQWISREETIVKTHTMKATQ